MLDNLEIYDDEVKALISSCESVDNAAENFQARQMDQTLYYLTVISATFLPAQFLTGTLGLASIVRNYCHCCFVLLSALVSRARAQYLWHNNPFFFFFFFLDLGVWGMNFENMPELEQEWGYRLFWILTVGLFLSAMILLNFGRLH